MRQPADAEVVMPGVPSLAGIEVVGLDAAETRELRRRVLYGHIPDETAVYPQDDRRGSFHLGARAPGGELVAVASWYPEATDVRPAPSPFRLRGMAVAPGYEGRGVGRLIFQAGVAELETRGGDLLWANARDTAVGFYTRAGMSVVGDGFMAAGGLPHHVVVLELASGEPPPMSGPAGG